MAPSKIPFLKGSSSSNGLFSVCLCLSVTLFSFYFYFTFSKCIREVNVLKSLPKATTTKTKTKLLMRLGLGALAPALFTFSFLFSLVRAYLLASCQIAYFLLPKTYTLKKNAFLRTHLR
jgi:hypothetical protein